LRQRSSGGGGGTLKVSRNKAIQISAFGASRRNESETQTSGAEEIPATTVASGYEPVVKRTILRLDADEGRDCSNFQKEFI
jgi:hypothetical protein